MRTRRLLRVFFLALTLTLTGCMGSGAGAGSNAGGPRTEALSADQVAQTDFNRVVELAMRDNLAGLDRLAVKLYRRNPREWRKAGWADHDAAIAGLRQAIAQQDPPADIKGLHDIQILSVALDPAYQGDRVAAFVYGMADTILAAHDGKTRFYAIHLLDAQRIYNAARNIEAGAWLLNTRHDAQGQPLLHANEITGEYGEYRNLSFEREFGALIARLDLVADLAGENIRRIGINYVRALLFFNFLPVR